MADYFLVLDGADFEGRVRPALAEGWRRRSFAPCAALCASLAPAARDYAARYHVGAEPPLLARVADGLPFDRTFWRALVGEVLLFAAVEIPQLEVNADSLRRLLAPGDFAAEGEVDRRAWPPVRQALGGSRDLTFGAAVYRPLHAGYNGAGDVARLAAYLEGVDPESWTPADLEGAPELGGAAERADELAFVREWFPELVRVYAGARGAGRVLVIEEVY